MTDKEIIIDGVDVSECLHLENGMCNAERESDGYTCWECCDPDSSNCYYKQLQRTKAQYDKVVEQNKSLQTELKQKEQECEELKNIISYPKYRNEIAIKELKNKSQEELIEEIVRCHQIGESTTQCVYGPLRIENDRYKQALDEIENFMIYEFSGQNEWVKTSVLNIINKAKEVKNGKTEQM